MSSCDNMFMNYNYINSDTIPNNNKKTINRCLHKEPFTNYDKDGNVTGYYWYFGDTVVLNFNISGEVIVEDGSIVFKIAGQEPDESTRGEIDQKAYNIIDLKAWVCVAIEQTESGFIYTWNETDFDNNTVGNSVYITAKDYLKDKKIKVQLFDFEHQVIRDPDGNFVKASEKVFDGNSTINFEIDSELTKLLPRGIYYCEMILFDNHDNYIDTIISQDNMVLNIK